jgi:quinoprotein dehydrogenase-associated probable ABC transporter substrate-binding protein
VSARRKTLAAVAASVVAAALMARAPSLAAEAASTTAFRVCQDPNNLPFSNVAGEGFENKIAELFARDLNRPVEYFSFPQRLAFVRNTLRYRLPGEDYRCDVMIGVPADFDQVSPTRPYYRSTYALVFAKGRGLDDVHSAEDFLKLGPARLARLKIGVFDLSPASQWLAKHDLVSQGVPYQQMNPDPDHSPADAVERDLAGGTLDVAILWGPLAGHMARTIHSREMVVVPLQSEPGVRFDYEMAMGVRYGEPEWKATLQGLIDKHRADIEAILRDYAVPVLPPRAAAAAAGR